MSTNELPRSGAVAAMACATTCLAVASVYAAQAVFGDIALKYGVSVGAARLAFSVCSMAYAVAFFVLGPLSDLFSARRLAGIGLLVAAVATLLSAATGHYMAFLIATAVQGAAAAAVPVAMFALMPRIARQDQIGTYFGLIIAATVVGITLGRAGLGLLTARLGLSAAQTIWAAVLLAMAVLTRTLPEEALGGHRRARASMYVEALRMWAAPDLLRLFATGFLLFFGYLGVVTFLTLRLHDAPFFLTVPLSAPSACSGWVPCSGRRWRGAGWGVSGLWRWALWAWSWSSPPLLAWPGRSRSQASDWACSSSSWACSYASLPCSSGLPRECRNKAAAPHRRCTC